MPKNNGSNGNRPQNNGNGNGRNRNGKKMKNSNTNPPSQTRLGSQGFTSRQVVNRTGRPNIRSLGDRIVVQNTEIAIEVTGTIATGTIPAGGAIRVFRFENVATGNNMNTSRWLTKLAVAYDKYRIRSMRLRWVTALPVTYGGQVALRWDSDPSKTATDTGLLAVSGDMRAVATADITHVTTELCKISLIDCLNTKLFLHHPKRESER